MTTAAALPLVTLTGDNLIRLGANVQSGQTVLINTKISTARDRYDDKNRGSRGGG